MTHVDKIKLLSKFYIIFPSLLFNDLYYFQHREWKVVKKQSLPLEKHWAALPSCGCRHSRRRMCVPKSHIWVCCCGFLSLSLGSCFSRLHFDSLWTICLKSFAWTHLLSKTTHLTNYWCLVVSMIKMAQLKHWLRQSLKS